MALTGLWRIDPLPQQRRTTVPIPAQGAQPPRIASQLAAMMAVVCMAWPKEGQPQPIQPQQTARPQTVALTLKYGQQPPLTLVQQALLASVVSQWPAPWNPAEASAEVAPLTAAVIPPAQPYTAVAFAPIAQWPPAWNAPPAPTDFAPLTLTYGAQPAPFSRAIKALSQWPPVWTAPQTLVVTAPLISVPSSIAPSVPLAVLQAWQSPTFLEQSEPGVAPLTIVILTAAQPTPPSQAGISAWPAPWYPAPALVQVAPLTLVYGQQPAPAGPLSALKIATLGTQWPPAWNPAQSASPNAAWSGTVIVLPQPCPPSQAGISAWPAPWYPPQELIEIAPLTLTYGQQPSVKGGMTPAQLAQAIVGQWPAFWTPAQVAAPDAAWNVPPAAPVLNVFERQRSVVLPWQALLQWQIAPIPGMAVDTAAWNVPIVSPHIAPARFPYDALWARLAREAPWNGSQITQPGGSWIISVIPPAIVAVLTGKYKPEHDSALRDEGAATGFGPDWARALADLGNAHGFSSDWARALRDLGDAGV